ncbi:MAG: flavin reductase [Agrobacterium albertimagni]
MNSIPSFNGPLETVSSVTREAFRDAMAKMGAAVNIITTDGPAGRAGFAATAVCSVTDSPATLLICLNRSASVFDAVTTNGVVCVNVLASRHEGLSNLFGGKTPVDERFAAADWSRGTTGTPILTDALVSFECRITDQSDIGTHRVLYCSVEGIHHGESEEALIYYRRAYRHVAG